jgi:hypothetical protein
MGRYYSFVYLYFGLTFGAVLGLSAIMIPCLKLGTVDFGGMDCLPLLSKTTVVSCHDPVTICISRRLDIVGSPQRD